MRKILFIIITIILANCSNGYVRVPSELPDDKEIYSVVEEHHTFVGFGPQDTESTVGLVLDDNENFIIPSASGMLYVVDKDLKRTKRFKLGERIFSKVAYQDGLVYVLSIKGNLIVLDIETGKITKQFVGETGFSAPIIDRNLIILQFSTGEIVAYNISSFQEVWRYSGNTASDISLVVAMDMFAMQGFIFAGLSDGRVILLEASSGRLVWQLNIGDNLINMPDESDLLDNIRSNSIIYNMNDLAANVQVDLKNGVLYVVPMKGYLMALSLNSLQPFWKIPMGAYLTPILLNDALIVIDRRNYIYRIDIDDGKILWKNTDFKDRNLTTPVMIDGSLMAFGDSFGSVHIMDTRDGSYLGKGFVSKYGLLQNAIHYDSDNEKLIVMDKYGMLYKLYLDNFSNRRKRG